MNLIIIVKITINQTNGNDDYGDNQPLNEDDEVDFRTVQSPKRKFLWSIQIQAIIVTKNSKGEKRLRKAVSVLPDLKLSCNIYMKEIR